MRQEFEAEMGRTGDMERQSKLAPTLRMCRAATSTLAVVFGHRENYRTPKPRVVALEKHASCPLRPCNTIGTANTGEEKSVIFGSTS